MAAAVVGDTAMVGDEVVAGGVVMAGDEVTTTGDTVVIHIIGATTATITAGGKRSVE